MGTEQEITYLNATSLTMLNRTGPARTDSNQAAPKLNLLKPAQPSPIQEKKKNTISKLPNQFLLEANFTPVHVHV